MAKETLDNPELLKKFSILNELTVDVEKETLERLLKEPEVSEKVESYIFDSDNPELKAYVAGQDKGRQQGHSEGFGKGVSSGVLTALGVVVAGASAWWLKDKAEG